MINNSQAIKTVLLVYVSSVPIKVRGSLLRAMDTSNSARILVTSEITPLQVPRKKPRTPLPKLQIGILLILQLVEPIASLSIFPYINQVWLQDDEVFYCDVQFWHCFPTQLIRELGITGGDDAAVGYYAGIIVGAAILWFARTSIFIRSTGIAVFCRADTDSV